MKEIGVFICNYNKADFVVKCVQALKNQTYKDLDIYVVDNASEDDSEIGRASCRERVSSRV